MRCPGLAGNSLAGHCRIFPSGWYCVSSASPDDTLKAAKSKKGRGGTAQAHYKAEARPASSQDGSHPGPSVVRADGVMVLLSPRIAATSRPCIGGPV